MPPEDIDFDFTDESKINNCPFQVVFQGHTIDGSFHTIAVKVRLRKGEYAITLQGDLTDDEDFPSATVIIKDQIGEIKFKGVHIPAFSLNSITPNRVAFESQIANVLSWTSESIASVKLRITTPNGNQLSVSDNFAVNFYPINCAM